MTTSEFHTWEADRSDRTLDDMRRVKVMKSSDLRTRIIPRGQGPATCPAACRNQPRADEYPTIRSHRATTD